VQREFSEHDPLIQALALHYHFAAMHAFLDGNGRAARALEAVMLQRVGLRDTLFIAMSNYYYEEKTNYLKSLAEVRAADHDLTPFLAFGLRGVEIQCHHLFVEIRKNVAKALFRNVMFDLFNRLRTARSSPGWSGRPKSRRRSSSRASRRSPVIHRPPQGMGKLDVSRRIP